MNFFIKEDNIRPGNRGGKDLFKWDNVRLLNNKDREAYLGVTQSIGFLDKGGKWRKRDWWQNYNQQLDRKIPDLREEKDAVKKEEERLFRESLNPGAKEKKPIIPVPVVANGPKGNLTEYEWQELVKKEANFKPEDSQLFEFYEDESHKAGLGMKSTFSFRTNPYEKLAEKNLTKLEGINVGEEKEEPEDNPYANRNLVQNANSSTKNSNINKYIREYMREKKEREAQNVTILHTNLEKAKINSYSFTDDLIAKSSKRKRSRSRSKSRDGLKERKKHKHSHKSSHKDRK